MVRAIDSMNNFSLVSSSKSNESLNFSNSFSNSKTNHPKIPASLYKVYFTGSFNPTNSKRVYIDYGNRLYEGVATVGKELPRLRANAKKINLEDKDLSNYIFRKSSFYKSKLQGTKLFNTDFENSNLYGANLRRTKTSNTNFRHTFLADADFSGAEFGNNTDMSGANIIGADFSNTSAATVNFENAIYNETTILPKDISSLDLDEMILIKDGVDLSNIEKNWKVQKSGI